MYFYNEPTVLDYQPSSWVDYPTAENPYGKYKFTSAHFRLALQSLRQINRQTYSLLDWLGDCGGLMDALFLIAEILVAPFASFALR